MQTDWNGDGYHHRPEFEYKVLPNGKSLRMGRVPPPSEVGTVARYRDSHHRIAQMFALGCTPSMIRQQTGISIRRLTLYAADPTFQELVAVYAARTEEKLALAADGYIDSAVSNMLRAEQQITDHLDAAEEAGELLPVNILDKISQGRADRFGYSKHSTVKHEHDFASALDRAIARSGKTEAMKTIDGTTLQLGCRSSGESAGERNPGGPTVQDVAAAPVEGKVESSQPPGETLPPPSVGEGLAPPQVKPAPRSFAKVLEPIKRRRIA